MKINVTYNKDTNKVNEIYFVAEDNDEREMLESVLISFVSIDKIKTNLKKT